MPIRKSILIFIIVAACLCSYFNTLSAGFVWDDSFFIIKNPFVQSFRYLPEFFTKDFCLVNKNKIVSYYYRPLLALSFMLNYFLWGESPFGYHLVNLIFHTLVSIMIFLFVEMLIKNRVIAFISAFLFAVHPIHTEAVSFISNISYVSAGFLFMSSLVLFLKYAQNKSRVNYLSSLICFFASLLIIEIAITLPLVVLCIDYMFISNYDLKKTIKNIFGKFSGFLVILVIYLIIRYYTVGWDFVREAGGIGTNFAPGSSLFWRIFTAIKIIALYIRILFLPYNLSTDYMLSPANSLFEPIVILGIILITLLIIIAAKNRIRYPILSFSILWFFATLLPVSNIVPLGNIFAERYMYIPSIGLCLGMGFFFSWLLHKEVKTSIFNWQKSVVFIFILLILALGRVTFERNKVWQDDLTLWLDAVGKSPHSPRAHYNLGREYFNLGLLDKAIAENNLALQCQLFPAVNMQYSVLNAVGHIYIQKGLLDEAIKAFKLAIEIAPGREVAYESLATVYSLKGEYEQAIEAALKAKERNQFIVTARYTLAKSYEELGLIDEAINSYNDYLKFNPSDHRVYLDMGKLYYKKGEEGSSKRNLSMALTISQDPMVIKEARRLLDSLWPSGSE